MTLTHRSRSYTETGHIGRRLTEAKRLQHQIQQLEQELSMYREVILQHMTTQDLDVIQAGDLLVLRKTRHKWTYSPQTEREMMNLRQTQRFEQSQGIASDNPTIYVSFSIKH